MIGLIDADSICYIIGYNNREHMDDLHADTMVQQAAGDMVRTMLTLVRADEYVGVFSPPLTFRHQVYKYAPYKGNRSAEKKDWLERFAPVIKDYLAKEWGFITVPELEADDVICSLAEYYGTKEYEWIILSPDKDLKQIPGLHYDYKKEGAVPCRVTEDEAHRLFWISMLTGDTTDNICGVPGLGPVKAEMLIKNCEDDMFYSTIVMGQYTKYFGTHYGPIIYQETKDALQLMSSKHRLWQSYWCWWWGTYDIMPIEDAMLRISRTFNGTTQSSPFTATIEEIEKVLDEDLLAPWGE